MSFNIDSSHYYNPFDYTEISGKKFSFDEKYLDELRSNYPKAMQTFEKANAISDLMQLPNDTRDLALLHPSNFLVLKNEDAISDFLLLPLETQEEALSWKIQGFLEIRNANALSELLRTPIPMQKDIISYSTKSFLQIIHANALSEFLTLPYNIQNNILFNPKVFIALKKADAIDLLHENLDIYLLEALSYINPKDLSLKTIMNTPDEDGITLLHRAARNGNLQQIDRVINELSENSVVLNPKVYFSAKAFASCKAPSAISQLDQIPIDEFAFPLIIAQNYCNTLIKMKDGSILTLEHTDAKKVYDLLTLRSKTEGIFRFFIHEIQKLTGSDTPLALANNKVSIYINPGHGFSGLECLSCKENGGSFSGPLGFYGRFGDDLGGWEHSEKNQFLKITFPINDEQARAIWERQNALRKSSTLSDFNILLNNCIDYTTRVFEVMGEPHPYQFFTEEQLAYTYDNPNLAIQYARFKYKYNTPTDTLFSAAHLISLYAIYQTSKLVCKIGNACLSSACNLARKSFTGKTATLNSGPSIPSEQKTPTFIKTGLLNVAGHALRYGVKMITGNDSTTLATATKYSLLANALLFYEVLSAGSLNPLRAPSLWNKKISLYVAAGLASTAASLSLEIAKNFLDSSFSNQTFAITIFIIYGLFFSLVGGNEIRKLYHSITEPPIIDGLSLQ